MADNVNTALEELTKQIERLNEHLNKQERASRVSRPRPQVQQPTMYRKAFKTTEAGDPREYVKGKGYADKGSRIADRLDLADADLGQIYSVLRDQTKFERSQGSGPINSVLKSLAGFAPPRSGSRAGVTAGPTTTGASVAGSRGGGGRGPLAQINHPLGGGLNDEEALTLAILGEHGGPAFLRNMAMEQRGVQLSLGWAQGALGSASAFAGSGQMGGTALGQGVSGALNIATRIPAAAADHPNLAYLGYKGIQQLTQLPSAATNWAAQGQQMGYGAPGNSPGIFGMTNPLQWLSPAAGVGVGYSLQSQALQGRLPFGIGGGSFGGGLTGAQADQTMQGLAGQGWSEAPWSPWNPTDIHGKASTIANQFAAPIEQRLPGLNPDNLLQFDQALRQAAGSTSSLSTVFDTLGTQALGTNETVNQLSASIYSTGMQLQQMGANPTNAYASAAGFNRITGLDPQALGQLAQSPIYQGLMMSQYGIMPSGIGNANPGALAGNATTSVKMLAQAYRGLDTNVKNAQGEIIETGQTRLASQIANQLGLPEAQVMQLLGDKGIGARATMGTALGAFGGLGGNTGMAALIPDKNKKLTNAQYKAATQYWNEHLKNAWQGTGVSHQKWDRISKEGNIRQRWTDANKALGTAMQNDPWNQPQTGAGQAETVNIALTGQAAQMFRLIGPSTSKQASNSGAGQKINVVINPGTGAAVPRSWNNR